MVFRKKKAPAISPERFDKAIPVINPSITYEEDESGLVTVLVPISDSSLVRIAKKATEVPKNKKVKLDAVGSRVWKKFDGKNRIDEIVDWMKREFVISEREANVSLSIYVNNLMEKKLLALLVPPPKPGSSEARVEIERIDVEMKELENAYKKHKIDENTYKQAKDNYEKTIKELQKGLED